MQAISFVKMNGLGNDFVVIDAIEQNILPDKKLIVDISDRHFGIGCDQVLWLEQGVKGILYRVFNSDGSEVGQCGNGARCVGHYMSLVHSYTKWPLLLETVAGAKLLVQRADNGNYSVDMGVPKPIKGAISDLHLAKDLGFYAVDVGNPHAIFTCDIDIDQIGCAMQAHAMFPDGVNVSQASYINSTTVEIKVYERGVGQTKACGSAAAAAAIVGVESGHLNPGVIEVKMPGGNLWVTYDNGSCLQSGPVDWVFVGTWQPRPESKDIFYYDFS